MNTKQKESTKITVSISAASKRALIRLAKRKTLGEAVSELVLNFDLSGMPIFKLKNPKGGCYTMFLDKDCVLSVNISTEAHELLTARTGKLNLSKSDYIEALIRSERHVYKQVKR